MPIGRSFQPGGDQGGPQGASRPPVQEAVRLMSLRLPQVLGAQAPTPQSLMQGMGGAGLGMGQGMSMGAALELLRRLIQQGGMGASQGFGRVPSPSVDFPWRQQSTPTGPRDSGFGGGGTDSSGQGGEWTNAAPPPPPSGPSWNEQLPGVPGTSPWLEGGPAGIAPGEFNPNGPPAVDANGRWRPPLQADEAGPY